MQIHERSSYLTDKNVTYDFVFVALHFHIGYRPPVMNKIGRFIRSISFADYSKVWTSKKLSEKITRRTTDDTCFQSIDDVAVPALSVIGGALHMISVR